MGSRSVRCPRCSVPLRGESLGNLFLSRCPACEGREVRRRDLRQLLEQVQDPGPGESSNDVAAPTQEAGSCSRCSGDLEPFPYLGSRRAVLQQCSPCDLVWLDRPACVAAAALLAHTDGRRSAVSGSASDRAALAKTGAASEAFDVFRYLVSAMGRGAGHPEQRVLRLAAQAWGLEAGLAEQAIRSVAPGSWGPPAAPRWRERLLDQAVAVALAGGQVSESGRDALDGLARGLGFTPSEVASKVEAAGGTALPPSRVAYTCRSDAGKAINVRLYAAADGMEVSGGERRPYQDVTAVRLARESSGLCTATLGFASGLEVVVTSRGRETDRRRDPGYVAFLRALHDRLVEAGATPRYELIQPEGHLRPWARLFGVAGGGTLLLIWLIGYLGRLSAGDPTQFADEFRLEFFAGIAGYLLPVVLVALVVASVALLFRAVQSTQTAYDPALLPGPVLPNGADETAFSALAWGSLVGASLLT